MCIFSLSCVTKYCVMWFTAPDNTFRMSSFRTKKWKRKYAVDKGGKNEPSKDGARPANNWEFMAFNNFWMRGDSPDEPDTPRGSPAISPPGSRPSSRPNSRPPSWLAQFTIDENEETTNDICKLPYRFNYLFLNHL